MMSRDSLTSPAPQFVFSSVDDDIDTPFLPPPSEEDDDASRGLLSPTDSPQIPQISSHLKPPTLGPTAEGGRKFGAVRRPVRRPCVSPNSPVSDGFLRKTEHFSAFLAQPPMMTATNFVGFGAGTDTETQRRYSLSIAAFASHSSSASAAPQLLSSNCVRLSASNETIDNSEEASVFSFLGVAELEQLIQRPRMRQIEEGLSFFNVGSGANRETSARPDVNLEMFCNKRDVHWFVMSFLAANGYMKALKSFKKHLPLDEQLLERSLYYHQEEEQQKQRQFANSLTAVTMGGHSQPHKKDSLLEYAMTTDDLLLFVMETARQEQLFNDTLPWRDINCQRKDYFLKPLKFQRQEGSQSEVNSGGNHSNMCAIAVGGSVDSLIEILIFSETDAPFTTGIPLFNYTNTFILLSSLFVLPEVLIVRLIRLFRHVQEQPVLEDSRRVFLQRRIVHVMIAYCTCHESDVTYKVIERIQKFLQSLGVASFADNCSQNRKQEILNLMGVQTTSAAAAVFSNRASVYRSAHGDEVLMRLKDLSALVEKILRRTHALLPDTSGSVSWQRVAAAVVKPLGTFLEATRPFGDTSSEWWGASSLRNFCPNHLQESQANVVFTSVGAGALAKQICILSFRMFASICLRELLSNAWCNEILRLGIPCNLSRFIDYSSRVERWIAASILSQKRWSECRAALKHGVRLCKLLYEKQNYELAAAVLAGLQHPCVTKLEELHKQYFWQQKMLGEEEEKEFTELKNLMDPFAPCGVPSSFYSVSERAMNEMETPIIPIIAPFLGVLFRTEELHGDTVEVCPKDGVSIVNWTKVMAIGKLVFCWLRCQNVFYNYTPDAKLQQYLWQLPGHKFSDETLAQFISQKKKPQEK